MEVGDVECDICNLTFKTTKSLRSHNEKVHAGKVLYQCSECGKGLMSKEGIEKHKLQHGDESEKLKCEHEGCKVTFSRKQSLKKHMKQFHGPGQDKYLSATFVRKK